MASPRHRLAARPLRLTWIARYGQCSALSIGPRFIRVSTGARSVTAFGLSRLALLRTPSAVALLVTGPGPLLGPTSPPSFLSLQLLQSWDTHCNHSVAAVECSVLFMTLGRSLKSPHQAWLKLPVITLKLLPNGTHFAY